MVNWLGISIFIIAIAFAVLVIFLAIALVAACRSLKKSNEVLASLKEDIGNLSLEGTTLLRNTNELVVDIQDKMHSVDSIFHAVSNVGGFVEGLTDKRRGKKEESSTLVVDVMQWVTVGATLCRELFSKRR